MAFSTNPLLRPRAVVCAVVIAAAYCSSRSFVNAQNLPLPPLPYEYDALEPHIDEATLRVHHLGHHAAYASKLNTALAKLRAMPEYKYLAKMGVDALLHHVDELPADLQAPIRNNGGGYVNHDLFWNSMSPNGGGDPEGFLHDAIVTSFGSVDAMKATFSNAAASVFGSGYAWLVVDATTTPPAIQVVTTSNQDVPQRNLAPLLVLDVWEHAYYLKYQNKRTDFIAEWWNIVDWASAERRYNIAISNA